MEIQKLKITEQERQIVSDFMGEEYPEEIDFNWLMPVVEKIDGLQMNIGDAIKTNQDAEKYMEAAVYFGKIRAALGNLKGIENVWLAAVEFIEWHNKNKKA